MFMKESNVPQTKNPWMFTWFMGYFHSGWSLQASSNFFYMISRHEKTPSTDWSLHLQPMGKTHLGSFWLSLSFSTFFFYSHFLKECMINHGLCMRILNPKIAVTSSELPKMFPESNIAIENQSLEDKFSFGMAYVQRLCQFQGKKHLWWAQILLSQRIKSPGSVETVLWLEMPETIDPGPKRRSCNTMAKTLITFPAALLRSDSRNKILQIVWSIKTFRRISRSRYYFTSKQKTHTVTMALLLA